MTGGLGRNHDDVEISAWNYLVEVDGETMREGEGGTLLDVGFDLIFVEVALKFVGGQNHDHIGITNRVGGVFYGQASGFCLGCRRRAFAQRDGNINARVFQVVGMGMPLRAVADDGDFLALDQGKVTVFIIINIHNSLVLLGRFEIGVDRLNGECFFAAQYAHRAGANYFDDIAFVQGTDISIQFAARAG